MTVKRNVYAVAYLDDDAQEIEAEVRVTMGDQMDAETHGPSIGLVDPIAQSRQIGALWLWFAMRRQGLVSDDLTFEAFKRRILDNTKLEPDVVPPTEAATLDESPSTLP